MDELNLLKDTIKSIHVEEIHLNEPFIDVAAKFAAMPGTVVLMSGGDLDSARHHILAVKPWLSFTGRGSDMTVTLENHSLSFQANPFDALRKLLLTLSPLVKATPVPVGAGLFGYLAYDLKDHLETLPRTSVDTLRLPHIVFYAPAMILVHDKTENVTRLCLTERDVTGKSTLSEDRSFFQSILASPGPASIFSGDPRGFTSNFTESGYIDAVKKVKEYISSGHVYQVNLSQRFETDFSGDAFGLFQRLYRTNPAPFFAYINAGDHQIVSTSPERFIQRTGSRIETRPIKGTRPRGKTPDEDLILKSDLLNSKKDDAELSMIVDLLRNDLGKVCKGGSVRVTDHKRIEAYENVYHLVSIVEGEFMTSRDSVDILEATFPGGSITGCPKIRSMEIIDELEPHRRHLYTGSIGYISFHDTLDLSIAIRTATLCNGKILFSVGGGIVFDSDPLEEFRETLHKGKTLMQAFSGETAMKQPGAIIWMNGALKPLRDAAIPVSDPGVQYGYGFFETIRANFGKPQYLDAHMERFNRAWETLFDQTPPDISWDEVIRRVLTENHLHQGVAKIKILATKGDREKPPFRNTLLVTASPYTHRLKLLNKPGLHLSVYPHPRQTPLADHKTLNYLYYFLAGKWAKERGADEALILNPDRSVSETNTANILILEKDTVIKPLSPHVLPGIMEGAVCDLLKQWGYGIRVERVTMDRLISADQVMVTNSLMGAAPVLSIDGKETGAHLDLCDRINAAVL